MFNAGDGTLGRGSAARTAIETHAAAVKSTPVDADELVLVDSADSWQLKKLTWATVAGSGSGSVDQATLHAVALSF